MAPHHLSLQLGLPGLSHGSSSPWPPVRAPGAVSWRMASWKTYTKEGEITWQDGMTESREGQVSLL